MKERKKAKMEEGIKGRKEGIRGRKGGKEGRKEGRKTERNEVINFIIKQVWIYQTSSLPFCRVYLILLLGGVSSASFARTVYTEVPGFAFSGTLAGYLKKKKNKKKD